MKTLVWRIAVVVLLLLAWAPAAYAWSWPVQGPVLQPFTYDESHPYASGRHRGIDIGADAAGEQVVAPAAGIVSFAGSVPTNGECVSIETPDGYTVTLNHLGAILVAKGGSVAEGQAVATIGPTGTPEFARPYVHLGIRTTSDPNGYLDPLRLLPPQAGQPAPAQSEPAATQPNAGGGSASAPAQPATTVAASTPSVATTRGSTVAPQFSSSPSSVSSHARVPARQPRTDVRQQRPSQRPAASRLATGNHRVRPAHRHVPEHSSSARRPVVEPRAPNRPVGLNAGHEIESTALVVEPRARPHGVARPLPVVLNSAAALVALAAALAARRRRRPVADVQVLHLPRRIPERRAA